MFWIFKCHFVRDILSDEQYDDSKETMVENLTGEKLTVKYFQTSGIYIFRLKLDT